MDEIWAAKIDLDGSIVLLHEKPTYEVLRDAVGGLIAPVQCPNGDVIYVDDEGLLKGLDPNRLAMILSRYPGLLVGPAIMVGPLDQEGDHLPLTSAAMTDLLYV